MCNSTNEITEYIDNSTNEITEYIDNSNSTNEITEYIDNSNSTNEILSDNNIFTMIFEEMENIIYIAIIR
jgi:hypothetical protein